MAEKLGEALLDLDTNDKGLKAGINRAERLSDGLGRVLDATSKKAMALGRNMAIGAAAGAAAMGVLIKRAIDSADEMSKAAASAGVTTEELSRLAWAGELSDVSLGSLAGSMGKLSNTMAQMAMGGAKDTKAIFDALGIAVTEADGRIRSMADVMPELAERFASMEDGADKTALAIQLFGRSGAALIPLLNSGRDGLKEMADESDRLGKTISTTAGKDAEQFNDSLTRIGAVVDGLALKVMAGVLPQLNAFGDKLGDPIFAQNAGQLASAAIGAMSLIVDAVNTAIAAYNTLADKMKWAATHDMFGRPQPEKNDAPKSLTPGFYGPDGRAAALAALAEGGAGWTPGEKPSFYDGMFPAPPVKPTPTVPSTDLSGLFSGLGGGAKEETDKVKELLSSLRGELDMLREMDPVQQRLISMRDQLAKATGTQRVEAEELIKTIYEETKAWEASQAAGQFFGDQLLSSIEAIRTGSKSLVQVLDDVINSLAQAVLQSMLLGQGPLSGLFGTQGAGGGLGGIVGSLFSGFFAKGGLIPNGTFGIVGENGPEPVIGTARGAQVLPNSSLAEMLGGGGERGPVSVTVNGSGLSQSEMTQAIADALESYDRHQLPQRVTDIQNDPLARG